MSPQGIFIGQTLDQLQELQALAIDRIKYGDRIALSGAAKSSSKNFSMTGADMLREVQYALQQLTGTGLPMRTYFDAGRVRC